MRRRWLTRVGAPVAHAFREADVAAGGEGAPLVPLFHAALAKDLPKPLAVLNIGGVANVTFLGSDGIVAACDTGPGNALLDDWVAQHTGQAFDAGGALAATGQVREDLLAAWLSHLYFARPLPKSLDRQQFHAVLSQLGGVSAADGAATLAAFTARAVAICPLPERPRLWLVTGGGRHNTAIMAALGGGGRRARAARRGGRLGWRRAGSAMLRLPRRPRAARAAAQPADDHRRAAPDARRSHRHEFHIIHA